MKSKIWLRKYVDASLNNPSILSIQTFPKITSMKNNSSVKGKAKRLDSLTAYEDM